MCCCIPYQGITFPFLRRSISRQENGPTVDSSEEPLNCTERDEALWINSAFCDVVLLHPSVNGLAGLESRIEMH